jgi:hypothetical protein
MNKIAIIRWQDPESFEDWHDISETSDELAKIKTVGYVIKETDKSIVVALSVDESNYSCSQSLIIPKVLIDKITYVYDDNLLSLQTSKS